MDVTVHVDNVEEDGLLVLQGLASVPVVGTAVRAQLTDDDGSITVNQWQWQRKQPEDLTWTSVDGGRSAPARTTRR